MSDSSTPPSSRTSQTKRRIAILVCCFAAVGGLGCMSMLMSERLESRSRSRDNQYRSRVVLSDTVFAIAKPDAQLAKKIKSDDALAFLGGKHTYLLVEGGNKLHAIAQQLDGRRLTLESTHRRLFIKGRTIWSTVALTYVPDANAAEIDVLRILGFKPTQGGKYVIDVTVKGITAPVTKMKTPIPDTFKQTRQIAFYHPPDSSPPMPDLTPLLAVPLALAADVALTPVYAFLFIAVMSSM